MTSADYILIGAFLFIVAFGASTFQGMDGAKYMMVGAALFVIAFACAYIGVKIGSKK